MRRTLVLSLGTAACGAALHARRRRQSELRFLRRRIMRASPEERPTLEERCQQLLGALRILAVDLDGTDAYRLPPPLDPQGGIRSPRVLPLADGKLVDGDPVVVVLRREFDCARLRAGDGAVLAAIFHRDAIHQHAVHSAVALNQ